MFLLSAFCVAAARKSSSGYLSTVGPAALRFQTLSWPGPALTRLHLGDIQPLSASEPIAFNGTAGETERPGAEDAIHTNDREASDETSNLSNKDVVISATPRPGPDPYQAAPITAQMFFRFFAWSTNSSHISSVIVPLGFRPAEPATRGSNSARYSLSKP